jgi:hypothetical protein
MYFDEIIIFGRNRPDISIFAILSVFEKIFAKSITFFETKHLFQTALRICACLKHIFVKKNFRKNKHFRENFVEENILAKIFQRNQYFRQHFRQNLPKTHVIKLFSQNGPFASNVSDKFCFFSKKLRKNLYLCKL